MAYDTEKLLKQAIKAIKEKNLFFIEDVVAYLPCTKPTFYEHKLNESNDLKEALLENRINVKVSMRKKWQESDNATLQMGLMKLVSTNEERKKLSQTFQDVTTDGERLGKVDEIEVVFRDFSDEEE